MSIARHLVTLGLLLAMTSGLSAGDWLGFRGLVQEGRGDSAVGPLTWSPSQNVVWKTAIPGRGHSSPVLCGGAIYLTAAYEDSHLPPIASTLNYAVFALALLFALTGVSLLIQSPTIRESGITAPLLHIRFFLFTAFLVGVTVIALFGRYLLNPGDDAIRHWLISIVLMLSCLILSGLLVPLRSRQQLAAGLLSIVFAVLAFAVLRSREPGFLDVGSLKGLTVIAASISPLFLGLALLSVHLLFRNRPSTRIQYEGDTKSSRPTTWPLAVTAGIGVVVALMPFLLFLYRAADYQIPDSYIWSRRVRPEVGWWSIDLFVAMVFVTIAGCCYRPVRSSVLKRLPLQWTFFVAASTLGVVFFIRSSSLDRPAESVRAVVCVNRQDGKILWICEGLTGQNRPESKMVTHASATPVTDGERIYAYFGEDGLMCVSPKGELLWKKAEPMFRCKFGVGTSPVVKDGILVIVSDVKESGELRSSITAVNCISGQIVWKKERKSHKAYAAYSTPLIKRLGGREVVIVHGWHDVKGYDLKTGEELWSYPMAHGGLHLVASLASDEERVYVVGARQLIALDFSKLGTDGNPLAWSRPLPGEKSSSPVVVNGLLFLVTESGTAFCLEAQTGEILWKERLGGRFFSCVVATAGKILFTNESGQTVVAAADRGFRELARNRLDESVYASLAPVGEQLFVRTDGYLYCIQENKQ